MGKGHTEPTYLYTKDADMIKPFAKDLTEIAKYVDINKPIRCYRNLHRKCLSIKQGVVRCHTDYVFLQNVTFPVNTKVRDKVRLTRRKEVHAYVMGYLANPRLVDEIQSSGKATYNPYTHDTFELRKPNHLFGYPLTECNYADIMMSDTVDIIVWE